MTEAILKSGVDAAHRIVVGLDGSPASLAALRWAIREARFTGCSVDAVYVWTASVSPFNNLVLAQAEFDSERNSARNLLRTAVAQVRDANPNGVVPVREELIAGFPAAVLRKKGRDARVVVLGKPPDRNPTRIPLLRKTLTHALTKHPPCRVVVVAADGSVASDTALP